MKKGDIVLVPFPFTDLQGQKNRPALILVASTLDVTVAFLSSQAFKVESTDIFISATEENGLKKQSLLRLNKIATLSKDLILGRLGNLSFEEIKLVDKNLIKLFQINSN